MTDRPGPTGSATMVRFAPGDGVAVLGARATLMLGRPASGPQIGTLIEEVLGGDRISIEALARMLTDDDMATCDFVLVDRSDKALAVFVRGEIVVLVDTAGGAIPVSGSGLSTWCERRFTEEVLGVRVGSASIEGIHRAGPPAVVPADAIELVFVDTPDHDGGVGRRAVGNDPDIDPTEPISTALPHDAQSTAQPTVTEQTTTDPNSKEPTATGPTATDPLSAEPIGTAPTAELPQQPVTTPTGGTPPPPHHGVPGELPSIGSLFGTIHHPPSMAAPPPPIDPTVPAPPPPVRSMPAVPATEAELDANLTTSGDHLTELRRQLASDLASGSATSPRDALVRGRHCPQGHLNPPLEVDCLQCGVGIDLAGVIVTGPRPRLGRIVLDDGASVTLDRPAVLGRAPQSSTSTGETAHAMRIDDPSRSVSAVHCELGFSGWEVTLTDLDSTNGTALTVPGSPSRQLRSGESVPLPPGSIVELGGTRTFTYEMP